MNKQKRIVIWVLLALMLGAQWACWALAGRAKDGFDIDELFTYGLANAYGRPFVQAREGEWVSGAFFSDYLAVGSHAHEYLNVYENQIADVHPPLYYLCMHAVCSVFRGFTKWTGIALNIAFLTVTQGALFALGCLLLSGGRDGRREKESALRWEALVPAAVYGFGAGAASSAVFIRMYAMMTMWVTLLALVLAALWRHGQTPWRMCALTVVLAAGFLTQYYFVIAACFLCAIYFFARLASGQGRLAARFAGRCAMTLCLAVGLFPWCLKHIFGGYRGAEAFERAAQVRPAELARWFGILFDRLSGQQFGGYLALLLALALALTAAAAVRRRRIGSAQGAAVALLAACLGYVGVIAAISPYKVDRYIFCVYPLTVLALFLLLQQGAVRLGARRGVAGVAALGLLGACAFPAQTPNYLFTGESRYVSICEAYAQMPCVVLGSNDMTLNLLELAAFDDVCVLDRDAEDEVGPALSRLGGAREGFVLFERYPDEGAAQRIAEALDVRQTQELFVHQYRVLLMR